MRRSLSVLTAAACLAAFAAVPSHAEPATLFAQGSFSEGIPAGGPYVPAGTLYDNEQSDGTTSLASANSSGTFTSRSADDFTIDGAGCASGLFDISRIRIQMVQSDSAPQAFGVDLYDDNGSGTAPTPANAIMPIATLTQTSQMVFGAFGVGTSIFEASFDTPGLVLNGDTTYWISGFGTNAAANAATFNNFFAASMGATGTTDNGVIIAPGSGVTSWTPADQVIGPPALAFSFAIDGTCQVDMGPMTPNWHVVPTLDTVGLAVLAGVLGLLSVFVIARRRNNG
ncbi:MAG: hypothetical protein HC897_17370 [Thermoanaerobaculia bacterium]|nr:hypothetical protein [Thermoanaerobaculia bacterium]